VLVGRNVQGDLDVIEPVIESVGPDELLCMLERGRATQSSVGGRQAHRRQKVEVMPYHPSGWRILGEDPVDLGVGGNQEVLRDDAP
jgi:hypothetical protein